MQFLKRSLPAPEHSACKNDTETVVNAKEGLRSTAILDAIHRSLESGKPEGIKLNI
jgi:hypothetical protein